MKYKIGDKVRIVKPKGLKYDERYVDSTTVQSSVWIRGMDSLIGSEHILDKIKSGQGWRLHGYWYFLEDWLEYANNTTNTNDKFNDAMSIL